MYKRSSAFMLKIKHFKIKIQTSGPFLFLSYKSILISASCLYPCMMKFNINVITQIRI